MTMSILVPLDGSSFAEHALPLAIGIAQRTGAVLHIVRAHEPPVLPVATAQALIPVDAEWLAALRVQDQEYLRDIADRCMEKTGLVVRTDLPPGPSSNAIVEAAQNGGDSLIVMTTHGRGGISRAWLGSVADAVVRRSGVPVLLIRPQTTEVDLDARTELHHVLIPVDGSALSEGIIDAALALGRLSAARYTLLKVVPAVPSPMHAMAISAGVDAYAFEELRRSGAAYLSALAERLHVEHGIEVDTLLVENQVPAAAILQQAEAHGVDMIALATHGRGGWTRMALGSVADKVMRGASVPVLLYRPTVLAEDRGGTTKGTAHAA